MKSNLFKIQLGGAAAIILATGLWLYVQHGRIEHAAIEKVKAATAADIQAHAAKMFTGEEFADEQFAHRQELFQSFFDTVQSPDLVRMKIWNRHFTVVWSDLRELVGQRFPDNHEVKEALEGGVELEMDKPKDEHISERAFVELSEIYVPFANKKGEIVGVFEVYRPRAPMNEDIQSQFNTSATSAAVAAVLALALLWLAPRFVAHGLNPEMENRA